MVDWQSVLAADVAVIASLDFVVHGWKLTPLISVPLIQLNPGDAPMEPSK